MIKNVDKEDLCQISLTGLRSLVLLGLLIKAPRSLEDIREAFLDYNIMDGSNSDDMLRIDINTLRYIGCEISRADHRTNNKYVLLNHPFKIQITKDEVRVIEKAFDCIKDNADIDFLMRYDELFKKIAVHIADNEVKEILLGISPLKSYSDTITDGLKAACKNKKTVKLLYKIPNTGKTTEIDIVSEKVVLQNNKLYLYGVDKNSKNSVYLNVKRILKLLSIIDGDDSVQVSPVVVKFRLEDFGVLGLEDNEKILCGSTSDGFVIEGRYHNEFYAAQRILSFGSKCKVLEPTEFKQKIIETLKRMKEIYNAK